MSARHPAKLIDWQLLISLLPRHSAKRIASRTGRTTEWFYTLTRRGEPSYSDGAILLEYWHELNGPDVAPPTRRVAA